MSHTICRRKTASALAAIYNSISFCSLEWHRLPRKHKEMGTGGKCPHRTLCFRQQNSHNPVFLTFQGSEQKNLHLLECSLPMCKSCSQLPWLIKGLTSCICFFLCHIHLCQHPSCSEASARANHCISGNLPSPYCGTNPAEMEMARTQLTSCCLVLPNSKQRVTVTLKLHGLHNSCSCFLSHPSKPFQVRADHPSPLLTSFSPATRFAWSSTSIHSHVRPNIANRGFC